MKIKVIDLFSNIANNKPVPNKIKISDYIYHFDIDESTYTRFINNDIENPRGLLEDINLHNAYVWFNLEVKIIEEKPKKIAEEHYFYSYSEYNEIKHEVDKVLYILRGLNRLEDKTKDLAKAVNYLLEKSDKDE